MGDELLRDIRITHVLDCVADPTKIRVVAEFTDDVSPAMPYLNALLGNACYSHEARILHFKLEHRMLTLYPQVLTMAKADDEADAHRVMDWLRALINDAFRRREEMVPSFELRRFAGPLDVYILLPKENCGQCSEATCMAFAFRLLQGRGDVDECRLLAEDRFVEHRTALKGLMEATRRVSSGEVYRPGNRPGKLT